MYEHPELFVSEPYTDIDHGVIKSGKEAQVDLVERIGDDGASCLIARKRYLPRQGRLWFIDFPQAIDIAANPQGIDFLHRDVLNIADWFRRHDVDVDGEELFADLLSFL